MRKFFICLCVSAGMLCSAAEPLSVNEIVRRSVAANNADWKAAPGFAFTERDILTKQGGPATKDYRVMMVDGSPYRRLIAIDGQPLSAQQDAQELRKLKKEMQHRMKESADERESRVSKYQKERKQDGAMMTEMADAFTFRLTGEQKVNGRGTYVLAATPKPGYVPKSRETKVLTGMRGRMWIDTETYQWAKVEAEVFEPVSFGLFIAKVGPGTKFLLEQAPAGGNIWLPVHFSVSVRASILGFSYGSIENQTFRDYQPNSQAVLQALNR